MALIEVRNFKKRFGSKIVHSDVNFSVEKGECLGLIGGSGSGKSVILRSLIGLEKPDNGEILIDQQDVVPLNEQELIPIRIRVAYVFQGGALFDSMTVFDNLAYPLREHSHLNEEDIEKRVLSTLNRFGLKGTEGLLPGSLSGGMQKRVGLVRATILNPEVVLYDEPTAGLDPYNTRKIQDEILMLKRSGTTSILVTHDMPTAFAVCDRMVLLLGGKIAASGTTEELQHDQKGIIYDFISGEKV